MIHLTLCRLLDNLKRQKMFIDFPFPPHHRRLVIQYKHLLIQKNRKKLFLPARVRPINFQFSFHLLDFL